MYTQSSPFWQKYSVPYHKNNLNVSSQKLHPVELNILVQYQHYYSEHAEITGAKPELYSNM